MKNYWGVFFVQKGQYNKEAEWLKQEKREMEEKEEGVWQDLTLPDLKVALRTMQNWKAPGLDQVQKFWLK